VLKVPNPSLYFFSFSGEIVMSNHKALGVPDFDPFPGWPFVFRNTHFVGLWVPFHWCFACHFWVLGSNQTGDIMGYVIVIIGLV
jgi:hypothetical protein